MIAPGVGRSSGNLWVSQLERVLEEPAAALERARGVRVRVVSDHAALAAAAPGISIDGTVQAVIAGDRRSIWFVASAIRSVRQALGLFAHEVVGHYALPEMLGPELFGVLQAQVLRLRDAGKWPELFAQVRQRYERDASGARRELGDATFASEAIAVFAEANVRTSFVQRAANGLRGFVRRFVPDLMLSQGELRQMLWEAGRWANGQSARLSVAERALGRTEAAAAPAEPAYARAGGTFYSALSRSVEAGRGAPRSATALQWKQWLDGAQRRGEFKGSERDWVGIDAWLDEQPAPIARAALAAFVRDNEVQVQEVVLSDRNERPASLPPHLELTQDADGYWRAVYADGPNKGKSVVRAMQTPREVLDEYYRTHPHQDVPEGKRTKYAGYRAPGGENYRELLLTLPAIGQSFDEWRGANGIDLAPDAEPEFRVGWARENLGDGIYRSSHWDQLNVLVHVRFDERETDGKRVLFIHEVQSDWHQAGRKDGYVQSIPPQIDRAYRAALASFLESERRSEHAGVWRRDHPQHVEAIREYEKLRDASKSAVPSAPFSPTEEWAMLAFKRVVRWAVDHDFDTVAWTTGEQAAEVFDLSKQVEAIDWVRRKDGTYDIAAFPKNGGQPINNDRLSAGEMADMVGKEIADRIAKETGDPLPMEWAEATGTLKGLDLKVGGEGIRGFYDKILPAAVGKWAKRFGARVGQTMIEWNSALPVPPMLRGPAWTPETDIRMKGAATHSVDITPQMRAAVSEGQPMFARAVGKPTFYSALSRSVEAGRGAPRSATALQWKQWLDGAQRRGEFKGNEREWLGIDAWLDERDGSQSKRFSAEAIEQAMDEVGFKSRHTIMLMRPSQFLGVAEHGRDVQKEASGVIVSPAPLKACTDTIHQP